jgi:hypothetical protein
MVNAHLLMKHPETNSQGQSLPRLLIYCHRRYSETVVLTRAVAAIYVEILNTACGGIRWFQERRER